MGIVVIKSTNDMTGFWEWGIGINECNPVPEKYIACDTMERAFELKERFEKFGDYFLNDPDFLDLVRWLMPNNGMNTTKPAASSEVVA